MPRAAEKLMRFDAIVYFALGGFALFFGLFFLVFLWDVPFLLYLCGPITIIPGTIALILGIMAYRREHAVIEFASWLQSYRRIRMDDMAQRIGKTRFEAEKLLGEALERDLVNGVIDRAADEFVLHDETPDPQVFVAKCPQCGGDVNKWAFPEEVWTCPYCERAVTTRASV